MINNTQTKEKSKVKNCNSSETKSKILLGLFIVILKLLLINGYKAIINKKKSEKFIKEYLLNNETINRTLNKNFVILDENQIEKTILNCVVVCKGSISNTQDFLKNTYNYNCSTGKISNIISKYSAKARKFNDSINLSNIKVGANDEIFKASKPILVGVEPKSNYIYLMKLEEKRDGITWWYHLKQKAIEQGLKLDKSVNDAGKGLNKGIEDSFCHKCKIIPDIFHCKNDFLKGIIALERKAYSKIKEEYLISRKYSKGKCDKATYQKVIRSTKIAINKYDNCHELYKLFDKCTSLGGYNYLERKKQLNYIINTLGKYNKYSTYIEKFHKFLQNNIDSLLSFVEDFYYRLQMVSIKENINPIVLKLMWKQCVLDKYSEEYNLIEIEILNIVKNDYTRTRKIFNVLIENTIRASSIVENINSLLRPYLDLKKSPNQNFLDLLQLYFNTRKFKRSNINSKIGYNPLELYTKKY